MSSSQAFDDWLETSFDELQVLLRAKYQAREKAIVLCRDAIRLSANGIRAVHRQEFDQGESLIGQARVAIESARGLLEQHQDIYWAGFVHDAQKEFAEASITLAIVAGRPNPSRSALGVEPAAYLNGLAEAVGELRRHLLDALRAGDIDYCERCLRRMDEIYGRLVTVDYPDAMTGGLRRNTDMVRGVLEKSRGDLTTAARQRDLERRLTEFEKRLGGEES